MELFVDLIIKVIFAFILIHAITQLQSLNYTMAKMEIQLSGISTNIESLKNEVRVLNAELQNISAKR